jgi:hypothetical protein
VRHRLALIAVAGFMLQAVGTVQADAVTDWNATATQAARDGHASSNEAARALAIVQIAVNDAKVAITRGELRLSREARSEGPGVARGGRGPGGP